uniref:Uncharacterized protein n=1 Tax=Amphimedon queenslandica TaxID=400682 RepID=A0A1X7SKA4_AMPQE
MVSLGSSRRRASAMDGRMLFFLYIAASMIAVTHSQDYTVRFPFVPGRFLVPEDGAPVPGNP